MEPGRQLDKLIAEKVMGFAVDEIKPTETETLYYLRGRISFDGHEILPFYSTHMEDTMLVVDKIIAGHPLQFNYNIDSKWSVLIDGYLMTKWMMSPQHAICIAALKFKGEQIK